FPGHFDQSMVVELTGSPDFDALRRAFDAVLAHHDALRMRFERVGDGWRQYDAPTEPAAVLTRYEVPDRAARRDVMAGVHASFDLTTGPLLRAVLFDGDAGRRPLLFIAVHHLVVDGV